MDPARAEELKRNAAEHALGEVRSGMVLGLGTGSTVAYLLELLGQRLQSGELRDIVGVPTSTWTESQARRLEIPLTTLGEHDRLDLAIDGADEVDPQVDLIKGMGGALLREKMVAQASERVLIIADARKEVARLGTVSPLPVEVVDWGHEAHQRFLESLGADVSLRRVGDAARYRSDNGHVILDCRFPDGIEDPAALESELQDRAGIVETGLFLGIADAAVIAEESGVRTLRRSS